MKTTEQNCISTIDELIELNTKKLELLKKHRLGLLQFFENEKPNIFGKK